MKATAKAPANIALTKFWGKRDEKLRIPMNDSISINLSQANTTTSVEFDGSISMDEIELDGMKVDQEEQERIVKHLDRIRKMAGITNRALVKTNNNFPKGAGMASSASGFAALTLAAAVAAGLKLSEKELSVLARLGSGSACRSIPDGWVEWKAGKSSDTSFAHSIHKSNYWDICDVIAVVKKTKKKIGSTEGHTAAESSPFFKTRILGMKKKNLQLIHAIKIKDFTVMGEILESEAINMHSVMLTSQPSLIYWNGVTLELMVSICEWRDSGLEVYFTIDAGPNVHIFCQARDVGKLTQKLKNVQGVEEIIVNKIADGAHLI